MIDDPLASRYEAGGVALLAAQCEQHHQQHLLALLRQRRTIRRLRHGPLSDAALARVLESARQTPAAYNQPPWHIVVVRERRAAFWQVVEAGFRERLEGERLERYLTRLDGFRPGVGALLIYEDLAGQPALREAWQLGAEQARAFVEQGLGMVQLALWLALTAEGLGASLQHWEWLIEARLAAFLELPAERYRLAAIMPIGHPDEDPPPTERVALERVVSRERFGADGALEHGR